MTLRLLSEHHFENLSLKGGCTGSSESSLVKMPHCWKSYVAAHIYNVFGFNNLFFIRINCSRYEGHLESS